MRVTDLKPEERLIIDRRRRREPQNEAAARLKISVYRLRLAESGERPLKKIKPAIGRIAPFEACFIHRHRSGQSVSETAKLVGISSWWLIQMEYGDQECCALERYWSGTSLVA